MIYLSFVIWILSLPVFASPQRIVSGMPAITEILYAIGAEDQIVGVTTNCNFPAQAKKKDRIGGFFLNLEKVVSLNPDLVILQEDAQKNDTAKFKRFGLPVYTIKVDSVNDVLKNITKLGQVTGRTLEAERLVSLMQRRISKVDKKIKNHQPVIEEVLTIWGKGVKKRKALVIVGFKPLVVAGDGTFIDDILEKAGVENVAADAKGAYPQYSFEKLVDENPQFIIIPKGLITKKQIQRDKRWKSLEAVRKNRILFVNKDIISRPGPRVVAAVEQIAEFIY